jgi:AraC-like DNA-binding protein
MVKCALRRGLMESIKRDAAPFRFSTDALPAGDRLAIWREVLGRVHLRMDVAPLGEAPVRSIIEQHAWSSVSLYFSETNAIEASRTSDLVSDGNDDFRLLSVRGAHFQFISNGTTQDMVDRDAALLFNGAVGTIRYLGPHCVTSIRIRRNTLLAVAPGLEERPIRRVKPASWPMLRMLTGYTELLRRAGPADNATISDRIARHLVDLVALALDPTEAAHERTGPMALREARLATIRADVLANLSQPQLSARTIAQRHGVSDRYVHLLFEETGQTFGQFVLEHRLKRAVALLTDPIHAQMRISDIALTVGFIEHSTFNRAFRRRFGDTPRGIRLNGCRTSESDVEG